MTFESLEPEQLHSAVKRAYLYEKGLMAKESMLHFMQMMAPDPENPLSPFHSAFETTPLARLLCQIIEKVDKGTEKRVCVSVGPQMGKSEVLSRKAPAWLSGRKPRRHMILGSYNDTFAADFGSDVRDVMRSERFKLVFTDHELAIGSEARDRLATKAGGKLFFVGVGGSGTGKSADIFFVDDPFKNDEDAQSETYREKVWKWFTSVALSRCHKNSAIVIVHTRWNEDDLIGRLCDPEHPEREKRYKGIADRWHYYNLPAIIEDPDLAKALGLTLKVPEDNFVREMFGAKPMAPLWEERKSLEFLAEAKLTDDRVFGALYMGKPSPDTGTYFKESDLIEYDVGELPENLRKYGASDHAVSEKQTADYTVLGNAGVDEDNVVWVLPDIVWERMETDRTVEELIIQMKRHKPELWWIENELISKSFGPFLKRRMHEEEIYVTLDPQIPSKDKRLRARSIQGLVSMRRVRFPRGAHWWLAAKQQLLKFPYGTNDDFVDWLSWIGLGLTKEYGAKKYSESDKVIRTGTMAWIRAASDRKARQERIQKATQGW